jgi:hypothetical protein
MHHAYARAAREPLTQVNVGVVFTLLRAAFYAPRTSVKK